MLRSLFPPLRTVLPDPLSHLIGLNPSPPLFTLINNIILCEGPIDLERDMNLFLQHPAHGYYRQAEPIGPGKDFGTAPEISQMFGEMVALWCLAAWAKIGTPTPFVLFELGPGRGTMLNDILRFTKPADDFQKAIRLRLLESNDVLKKLQQERLADFNPVHIADLTDLEPLPMIVLANEFFDNIPLRQFVKTSAGWQESVVNFKRGRLTLSLSAETLPLPPDNLYAEELEGREEGCVHEFSNPSRHMIHQLASHFTRYNGAALLIDYAYAEPSGRGTLDSWFKSRTAHILDHPGNADVTADVDIEALARVAETCGAEAAPIIGQREFLARLGIGLRAEFLKKHTDNEALRKKVDLALDMLMSPSKMVNVWKVLVLQAKTQSPLWSTDPTSEGEPHA